LGTPIEYMTIKVFSLCEQNQILFIESFERKMSLTRNDVFLYVLFTLEMIQEIMTMPSNAHM